jgi:hypothetical protein
MVSGCGVDSLEYHYGKHGGGRSLSHGQCEKLFEENGG